MSDLEPLYGIPSVFGFTGIGFLKKGIAIRVVGSKYNSLPAVLCKVGGVYGLFQGLPTGVFGFGNGDGKGVG